MHDFLVRQFNCEWVSDTDKNTCLWDYEQINEWFDIVFKYVKSSANSRNKIINTFLEDYKKHRTDPLTEEEKKIYPTN